MLQSNKYYFNRLKLIYQNSKLTEANKIIMEIRKNLNTHEDEKRETIKWVQFRSKLMFII